MLHDEVNNQQAVLQLSCEIAYLGITVDISSGVVELVQLNNGLSTAAGL